MHKEAIQKTIPYIKTYIPKVFDNSTVTERIIAISVLLFKAKRC